MVTIFTFPRPFKEPFLNAQKNAINSWKKIHPNVEIYLINDEENSSKAFAKKNGIKCIDGKFSEFGTPLLKDALEKIKQLAKHKDILFFNTDIIYIDGMLKSINKVHDSYEEYFVVGRRVNIDLDQKIDFNNKNYKSTLVDLYNKGDMQINDQQIKHNPTACNSRGCVCLSITENDVVFFGKFGSALNLFTFIKSFFK